MLYKSLLFLSIIAITFTIAFINLGKFIDVTQDPIPSDIIVSLGGDQGCRLNKSLKLYNQEYSTSNLFIYTGRDTISKVYSKTMSRKDFLKNNGIKNQNIIHIDMSIIQNTMEEVLFIKEYMIKNNFKTVLFISHPQHSRRISIFAKYFANYEDAHITFRIVSCNPKWWNPNSFYLNEMARNTTLMEIVKLIYNVIKYSPPFLYFTTYYSKLKNKKWEYAVNNL